MTPWHFVPGCHSFLGNLVVTISLESACALFEEQFSARPVYAARAPGRVNLIGEHTDYNHGFVLPMAIERETVILAKPAATRQLRVHAANFQRTACVPLGCWARNASDPWIDYLAGVAKEVEALGHGVPALDICVVGDVPIGSGLSSSASFEMAALALFERAAGFALKAGDAAALGQRVENRFLGVSSGIMDQFISRAGRAGHALFLDCRTHAVQHIPVAFPGAAFVIADTGVARGLTASKYNERVAQCADAVRVLADVCDQPGTHLRDFNYDDLRHAGSELSDVVYRRARHVITENERTIAACDALRAGDLARFGKFMNESDESLRKDYEVTCRELDVMTGIARGLAGCYGSRMTGAGFGGCTVSLVRDDTLADFCETLRSRYFAETGRTASIISSTPAAGASNAEL